MMDDENGRKVMELLDRAAEIDLRMEELEKERDALVNAAMLLRLKHRREHPPQRTDRPNEPMKWPPGGPPESPRVQWVHEFERLTGDWLNQMTWEQAEQVLQWYQTGVTATEAARQWRAGRNTPKPEAEVEKAWMVAFRKAVGLPDDTTAPLAQEWYEAGVSVKNAVRRWKRLEAREVKGDGTAAPVAAEGEA